nr:MAG TPA: hypothetical protein [Caudoviricetes sp.]
MYSCAALLHTQSIKKERKNREESISLLRTHGFKGVIVCQKIPKQRQNLKLTFPN